MNWLRYLWMNEDGFFGIGMGPSGAEQTEAGALGNIGNFGTSLGEKDLSTASNFWSSILSGDPGSISKVLGPQISGINKRGQESKMTGAQFGNRGGGTNAAGQMTDDNTRSSIDSMISSLTGQAGSALGSLGSGLLSTGLSAHNSAFSADQTIQQQKSAKMNDLFKSIASVAAAPFTGGASLTGLTGGSGGGGGGFSLPKFGGGGGSDEIIDYGVGGSTTVG